MANALDHLNAGRTRVEWLAQLNTEYTPSRNYRRTSIICTIGPKTNNVQRINELRKGMFTYHVTVLCRN
jgi:pyruvate kinase